MAKKPKIQTRKPPSVEQFIKGTNAQGQAKQKESELKSTQRVVKSGDRMGQIEARVTVCLPDELVKKAKMWCITHDTTLSAVVEEALRSRVG